jgi:hypothetical protein
MSFGPDGRALQGGETWRREGEPASACSRGSTSDYLWLGPVGKVADWRITGASEAPLFAEWRNRTAAPRFRVALD